MTDKLRLNSIFDKSFLVRFERNKNNLDSSLVILTEAFRKSDNYLKNDKRKEISALILIGGWVETLHFATNINLIEKNEKVIHHIGEQKETIATILEILKTYNYTKEVRGLTIDFNELKFYFEQVKTVYSYMQPVTNANEKKTTLRHTLTINIDDKLMYDIAKKSEELRDKIIKQNF